MGIVDRALARHLGPERALPRWVDDLLDETFLWVAAGHLLLTLGVPAEQVRRLGLLREHLEEARRAAAAAGSPLPRLEEVRTWGDLEALGAGDDGAGFAEQLWDGERIGPLARAHVPAERLATWIEDAVDVLGDLALAVLDALDRHRIRPGIVGVDPVRARTELGRLRALVARADLRGAAARGHDALEGTLHALEAEVGDAPPDGVEIRPLPPTPGELRRLVTVFGDLPPDVRRRLVPLAALRVPAVQRRALDRALASLRADWTPPAERRRLAEEAGARREETARRAEEEQARRRAADRARGVLWGRWALTALGTIALAGLVLAGLALLVQGAALLLPPHPLLAAAEASGALAVWTAIPAAGRLVLVMALVVSLLPIAGTPAPLDPAVRPRQAAVEGLLHRAASTVVGAYLVGVLVLALGKLVLLVAGS